MRIDVSSSRFFHNKTSYFRNMTRTAGQPTKSSFEIIKTQYWFNFIKKKVKHELLSEVVEEIRTIYAAKNSGRKWDRRRLRSLIDKEKRLLGEGTGKNLDIKFTEIQKHFQKKELEVKYDKLFSDEGLGKIGSKIWGRYASGQYTPSRILEDVTHIYPTSEIAYHEGPNRLFAILESNTFREALELLEEAVYEIYIQDNHDLVALDSPYVPEFAKKANLEFINLVAGANAQKTEDEFAFDAKTTSAVEMFYGVIEFIKSQRISLTTAIEMEEYDYPDYRAHYDFYMGMSNGQAASIFLSIGFIAYKYLGDERVLPLVAGKYQALKIIERRYSIKESNWFYQKGAMPNGVIAIFKEMEAGELYQEYLNLVVKSPIDPIINKQLKENIETTQAATFETSRFKAVKKTR